MAERKPIRILSLDGGDSQNFVHQLHVLDKFMNHLEQKTNKQLRPCDYFDLMIGVGSSAPIIALLGLLGMTIEETRNQISKLCIVVSTEVNPSAETRAQSLETAIQEMIKSRDLPEDVKLSDVSNNKTCKVALCYVATANMANCRLFRNYSSIHQSTTDASIVDAIRASWTTPGFAPVLIGPRGREEELMSAIYGFSNPTLEGVKEAYNVFGPDARVACILSLDSGSSSTSSSNKSAPVDDTTTQMTIIRERVAEDMSRRAGNSGVYYRLSADGRWKRPQQTVEVTKPQTSGYPSGSSLDAILVQCIAASENRSNVTLEQIYMAKVAVTLPSHNLPPLSAYFVMRRKSMEAMIRCLVENDDDIQRIMILSGMGGCGKTQMVLRFARDFAKRYRHILFIDASSNASIEKSIIARVRSISPKDPPTTVEEAIDILGNLNDSVTKDWLLIFDNADESSVDLNSFIPRCDHGSILITTRDLSLGELAPFSHLKLDVMDPEEAVAALLSCVFPERGESANQTAQSSTQERYIAAAIVDELGRLPIAVIQAGCYIRQHQALYHYLDLLKTNRANLLKKPTRIQRDTLKYPHSVYASFEIILDALEPRAVQLLGVLSFFHFTNFPRQLLFIAAKSQFRHDPFHLLDQPSEFNNTSKFLADTICSDNSWEEGSIFDLLEELQKYSLVTIVPDQTTTLRFHPLVLSWSQDRLKEAELSVHRAAAVRLLVCGITTDDEHHLHQYLSQHVSGISSQMDDLHVNDRAAISQLIQHDGKYDQYLAIWQSIYWEIETKYGNGDMRTSQAGIELAGAYRNKDRLHEAEAFLQDIVIISEFFSDRKDPIFLQARFLLSCIIREAPVLTMAEDMQKEVLRDWIGRLGFLHVKVAEVMMELSITLDRLSNYEEQRHLVLAALAIRTKLLGQASGRTIESLEALAQCEANLGRFTEAKRIRQEVLKLRYAVYGRRHISIVAAKLWMASLEYEEGLHEEASTLWRSELENWRASRKVWNAGILDALDWLANMLYRQQQYDSAEELWQEELKGRRELQGDRHQLTLATMHSLAASYLEHGKYSNAQTLWEELLDGNETEFGEDHSKSLAIVPCLAKAYLYEGRYADAERLWERLLKTNRDAVGDRHVYTLDAMGWLALTYTKQGRHSEAAQLLLEEVEGRREFLGVHDETTLNVMNTLATAYYEQGLYDDAAKWWGEEAVGRRDTLGGLNEVTLDTIAWQASALFHQGKYADAQPLWKEVMEGRRRVFGEYDARSLDAMDWYARVAFELGDYVEAEKMWKRVIEDSRELAGADIAGSTRITIAWLAEAYAYQEKYNEVESLWKTEIELGKSQKEYDRVAHACYKLAKVYYSWNWFQYAKDMAEEAITSHRQVSDGEEDLDAIQLLDWIVADMARRNDIGEATNDGTIHTSIDSGSKHEESNEDAAVADPGGQPGRPHSYPVAPTTPQPNGRLFPKFPGRPNHWSRF